MLKVIFEISIQLNWRFKKIILFKNCIKIYKIQYAWKVSVKQNSK